jgi:hypothetical protein
MLVVGLALAMLALVGCGEKKTTIKTPEGTVTYEEGKGESEVTYGGQTYKGSENEPTEEQLGAPIYPGADYVPGSGGSGSITSEGSTISGASGEYTTSDSFDKVVSFYKGKLGEPTMMETTTEKTAYWMLTKGDQMTTTVSVTVEGGKTVITIASFGGAGI